MTSKKSKKPVKRNKNLIASHKLPSLGGLSFEAFEAIDASDTDNFVSLCNHGLDLNSQDAQGMTLAMRAILRGSRGCLGELMKRGFDHGVSDAHGQTIFDYFPRFGCLSQENLAKTDSLMANLAIEDMLIKSSKN